jgi:hypothetical protein
MFLCEIQDALVEMLRARVRNGEITERALARLVGVSQPHLHHVLNGKRRLSTEMMDRCLYQLRMSTLDLMDRSALVRYLDCEQPEPGEYCYLPVLAGRVGPTFNWPTEVEFHARFPVRVTTVRNMWHPVIVRTGFDARMRTTLSDGDYLLLDQARTARLDVDTASLYLIRRGSVGLVRRLRRIGQEVYLVAEDAAERPGLWEKLPAEGASLLHFIRARASLIAPEDSWIQPRANDL